MARILVVDDDAGIRGMLPRMLGDLGHEAIAVASTSEALSALDRGPFDLLILDIMLDKENGWETLRLARERTQAPALMFSGASMDGESLTDALTLGAQAVLQKPFERAELVSALERLLPGARA